MFRYWTRLVLMGLAGLFILAGCAGDSPEQLIAAAKQNIEKKDFKTAIIQTKNALQQKPDLAEGRYLLGKALLQSNDFAGAQLELAKALELKYSADLVVPDLLRARVALGQFDQVIAEASAARVLSATSRSEVKAALAAAYAAQGKNAQAQEAIAAALADSPGHARTLMVAAGLKAGAGDAAGALRTIEEAVAKDPANPESHFVKGRLLASSNQADQAIAAFRNVLAINPDAVEAHKEIIFLLMDQGKADDAKTQIAVMSKVAPNHASTLMVKAMFSFASRDYAAARVLSLQLLKRVGDNPFALQLAGAIEYQLGSYVQARDHLVKAVKLAPNFILARRWLALNELAVGSPARALVALEPILGLIEKDASMQELVGEIHMQLGDVKKGEAVLSKALKLAPKDVSKRTTVALARFVNGEEDAAIRELSQTAAEDAGILADRALVAVSVRRREFDKALKLIDGIEKKTKNSAAISNMRGQVQMLKGDPVAARASFERALALAPEFYSAAASLAELDIADGKAQSAQQRFESLLAANPKNTDAYVALAKLKAANKAPAAEVLDLIRKAVSSGPTEPGPRVSLISYLVAVKEYSKAVVAAQDAVAAIPDSPQLLNALGSAHQVAGEGNQAIAIFSKLAVASPGTGQPYLRIAEIQAATGDMEAAARTLRKALDVQPDFLAAQRGLVMFDIGKGKSLDAVSMARQVQKQRPNEATGYLLEGAIGASRKSWDEAADAYRQGLKKNPASTELAIRLHASLSAGGKKGEADRFAESWLKSNPKDFVFRSGLADRARDRGDYAAAAALYRSSLEIAPENPLLLNNLAWVSGKLKQPDALALAERANKLAPDQPAFMDTLAVLLAEKGETGRALELMGKAVRAAPNFPEIRFNYAGLLIQAGKKAEAKNELQELAKLGEKFPQHAEVAKLARDL